MPGALVPRRKRSRLELGVDAFGTLYGWFRYDAIMGTGPPTDTVMLHSTLPSHPELRCAPLSDDLADMLVARTRNNADLHLRDMTSDLDRFSSSERIAEWRRARKVLCLLDRSASLIGIVWVGAKPLPRRNDYVDPRLMHRERAWTTFAIRLYDDARGKGLSFDFAEHALGILLADQRSQSLWYQTRADNLAARSLGERMGFFEASGEAGGTVVGVRFAGFVREGTRSATLQAQ